MPSSRIRRAADAFPWWDAGPGRAALARALVAMWTRSPWREPLDDRERDIMRTVDEDLRAARKAAGPRAPAGRVGGVARAPRHEDEEVTENSGRPIRSAIAGHDLDVELIGGWHVRCRRRWSAAGSDDGASYWATDGDRVVEFTSMTANDETISERLLAVAPEQHPVIATRADGTLRGRAESFKDSGEHIVVALVADAPHVGLLTVKGADDDFALRVWRTLHRP